jgi:hypothetical protein
MFLKHIFVLVLNINRPKNPMLEKKIPIMKIILDSNPFLINLNHVCIYQNTFLYNISCISNSNDYK